MSAKNPTLFPELLPPAEYGANTTPLPGPVWIVDNEEVRFSLTFALAPEFQVKPFVTLELFRLSVALDQPGCLILDAGSPELEDGLAFQRELAEMKSPIVCIFLAADAPVETVVSAISDGAAGYFTKPVDPEALVPSVRRALEQSAQKARKRRIYDLLGTLSARELQIFERVCLGYRSAEIGEQLFLSQRTIEVHRAHIARKLGTTSASRVLYELCLADGERLLPEG